jgi:hypothetical protein
MITLATLTLSPDISAQEYFQQEVNYIIHVTLDDAKHELSASETVDYINNSPDTLRYLWFHLWPNAYSDNSTELAKQLISTRGRERLFNDQELKGYIDSLDFKADERSVQWSLSVEMPDICRIELNDPLCPGDKVTITTPFRVKIPKGVTSRLGHSGQSYQISQWYPKPAVYDMSGWHQMPYLDQGEFFSEFGSFDVSVTLPENYTVGATGELNNEEESARLDKLAADTTWKNIYRYGEAPFPLSSARMKTLRYTAMDVHDFAWFADKRFHVIKGKVMLPDSGREVTTFVMFTDRQAVLWKDALDYVNSSILRFSEWIGDYPYGTFTAVQSALSAGAGMEYPGITVIGLADDAYALDEVIAHEACHNWFYSALGSNERRYPYMDESIVSAYTARYMNERYPGKKLWEVYVRNRKMTDFFHLEDLPVTRMDEIEWLMLARSNLEQKINLQATDYSSLTYSLIIYGKAATGFNYLRAYLGNPLFDSTMSYYYSRWNSMHPAPEDLRAIFESRTGKDLSWFFTDLLGTVKRLDYKIIREEGGQLVIRNKGELASPLLISGMKGDSVLFEKWEEGFAGRKSITLPPGDYSEIKIDPLHVMPELYRLNNNIKTSGIFRKSDSFRSQLLFTLIEDPDKPAIVYIPTVNWNRENGFMAGVALHNGFIIPKPVEYLLIPFYGFKNSDLGLFGRISFNITPYDSFVRMATISLEGSQFGAPGNRNFHKVQTGLQLFFRPSGSSNSLSQKVYVNYIAASGLSQILLQETAKMSSYLQFGYVVDRDLIINPFNLSVTLEAGKSYQKTGIEFNYRQSYYGSENGLDMRLFAGAMLNDNTELQYYSLAAGGRGGREQYLYGGTFPGRFSPFPESFWSRQMTLSEGGLVSPVNDSLGYSNWLISLSFTSTLPGRAGKLPVKPFVNLLLNDHGPDIERQSPLFFEAGLKAGIWDLFEIFVPLVVSGNIRSVNGQFKDRIRFVFRLDSFQKSKLKTGFAN